MSNSKEIVYAVFHAKTQKDAEIIIDSYAAEKEKAARVKALTDARDKFAPLSNGYGMIDGLIISQRLQNEREGKRES